MLSKMKAFTKAMLPKERLGFLKISRSSGKRGEGRGVMASGFLTEVSEMILLSNEDLQHINNMRTINGKWGYIFPMT